MRELEEWLEDTREAMAKFKAQSETDERIRSEALRRKHEVELIISSAWLSCIIRVGEITLLSH